MLTIKDLQEKVNEIAAELDGLETMEKLQKALWLARHDDEVPAQLLDILEEALSRRFIRDSAANIRRFLAVT